MSASQTVPLETLMRAHMALEAVHKAPAGDPLPFPVAMQVAAALGHMNAAMGRIGRTQVEVTGSAA